MPVAICLVLYPTMPRRDLAAPTASLSCLDPEPNPCPRRGLPCHQPLPGPAGSCIPWPSGRTGSRIWPFLPRTGSTASTGSYVQEMEIINLGKADGLPPVDWATVAEKLDAGSPPAPDAANSRTTWLATVNENGSPHVTAVG